MIGVIENGRRAALAIAAAGALGAGALAVAAAPAGAAGLACGATITKSTTLTADIVGCAREGIKIGADRIVLDLNGHTVSGGAGNRSHGILNKGYDRVVVRGGTVTRFGLYGVRLADADRNLVQEMRLTGNLTGIGLVDSTRGIVRGNDISDSGFVGVNLTGGARNRVEANTIADSRGLGVFIQQSLSETGGLHRVVGNTIRGNGIWVSFGARATSLLGNSVSGSDRDGISAFDPSTIIGGNVLTGNRAGGINAPNGAADAGGNTATGNGGGQCLNVACP